MSDNKILYKVVLTGTERWWVNALLNNVQVEDRAGRRVLNALDDALQPEELSDTITLKELDELEGVTLELTQKQFDMVYKWLDAPMPARTSRVLRKLLDTLDDINEGDYVPPQENSSSNGTTTEAKEESFGGVSANV